jgi:choline dehydrogenase-like flavoprotein
VPHKEEVVSIVIFVSPFGAYFSTQSSTLPAAMATKRLTVRPYSIVNHIIYDKDTKKAKGVMVIDAETNESIEFYAKIVFVNGSTLGSTFILLNSTSEAHPNGLGNASGQLGHNLMDHHFVVALQVVLRVLKINIRMAEEQTEFMFQDIKMSETIKEYLRGFGYQGGASRGSWHEEVAELEFGGDFKDKLSPC